MTSSTSDLATSEPIVPTPRSITVLIPTYKRPEFLRCALESVRNQSRLDLVAEIVVSENSEDPRSEVVCRDFPDLPVSFTRQSPPVDMGQHFARLPSLAGTPLIALLGDDDMWGRYHLEESARLLASAPEAVACINMAVIVPNSGRGIIGPHSTLLQSHVTPWSDQYADHWIWLAKDVLLASLLGTPLNMWSIVGKRPTMAEAMSVFQEPDQGTDADRFMIWRIAKSGRIVIGREVGLYYRLHSNNACARMESEDLAFQRRSWQRNLERMLNEAAEMGIDAKAEWQKTFADADLPGVATSPYPMTVACRKMLLERWGPVRQLRGADVATSFPKAMARELLPPALYRGLSRIYGLLK